jgi:lipopolysaccharide transport protein LptA
MPAAYYIISVQVALVAASAAYLSSDTRNGGVPAAPRYRQGAALVNGGVPGRMAIEQESPMGAAARRFVMAEQVGEAEVVEARNMGFRVGAPKRDQVVEEETGAKPEGDDLPMAVPVEGDLADSSAQLSEIGVPEVEFEPVPDGAGYSITADSATNFDLKTKTVVFSGNVSLHCADFTLSADRLVVHMDAAGGALNRLVANGDVDVHLTQGTAAEQFHGSGEEATFDPKAQSIVFLGWPRIMGQGREHRAASASTKMTLFTKPAKLVTEGRAQTRILAGEGGTLPGMAVE